MSTPAGLHQFQGWWACNACGAKFNLRTPGARKAAREHVSTHKEVAVAEQQQGAWDVRVVIERKGVAAQSGIEAISAVTAQLDREGIVVAEVHAHRADGHAVEVRSEQDAGYHADWLKEQAPGHAARGGAPVEVRGE